MRYRMVNGERLPSAVSCQVYCCGDKSHLHLIAEDEHGGAFAEIVISLTLRDQINTAFETPLSKDDLS